MKREAFDPISPLQSRAPDLTQLAHRLLLEALAKYGNGISSRHAYALRQLVSGFTDQGLHLQDARRIAYALPCGAGKTLAVVAWIVAQHQLGLGLSLAISAQQIDSLCVIKSSLVVAGVPEHLIGIRHTKGSSAAWPDTEDQDRPIMLGSHARIQGKDEMPSFCMYKGKARDLLIWDESLISSDATTLKLDMADTALSHFAKDAKRPILREMLVRLQTAVEAERKAQGDNKGVNGISIISEEESDAALAELGTPYCSSSIEAGLLKTSRQALSLLKHPVSLLDVGAGASGRGLMRYRIMVAAELENIAVLDASFVVRELCRADPTIIDGTTEAMRSFKSYSQVLIKQTIVGSGRYHFAGGNVERIVALDAAITSIRGIPTDESVLVFTFKDESESILRRLKAELRNAGIDTEAKLSSGRPRFAFRTWGMHTTDNAFSDCKHVVLLGVLRMSRLTLAASMAGQKNDLLYRMSTEDLQAAELSELASNIMQAMNRGRCRKVDADGRALPMTVHLLTKERGLQPLLQRAMRGLQWETIEVETDRPATKTEEAAELIVAYVLALPGDRLIVTKKEIFSSTGIKLASASKAEAMARAMTLLREHAWRHLEFPWTVEKLSLVRKRTELAPVGNLPWLRKASLGSNRILMEATEAMSSPH